MVATDTSHSLLVALIAALGAGTPALIWQIFRSRKTGPGEREEVVSRAAKQAVEAMDTVLAAERREREQLQRHADECTARAEALVRERDAACKQRDELLRERAESARMIASLERRLRGRPATG